MIPKVFIGIITSEAKKYAESLFMLHLKMQKYPNVQVLIIDNSEEEQYYYKLKLYDFEVIHAKRFKDLRATLVFSRNLLRTAFLKSNSDYFFSLESDVLVTPDTIEILMQKNKDIISGIYCYPSGAPIAFDYSFYSDELKQRVRTESCRSNQVIEIKVAGLGCLLVKRHVIEKILFRFEENASGTDDVWFCLDAIDQGIRVFLDTSVKCAHFGNYYGKKEIIQFRE